MAHPYAKFRQSNVERARVGDIAKGYDCGGTARARGGKVHKDEAQDRKLFREMAADGEFAKARADRPRRASGGKVKKGTTVVNVITQPAQPAPPPPVPMPPPAAAAPPVPPPAASPPPGLAGAGPGLPPGAGPMPPMRARGGGVKAIGMDVGTPVQHSKAKSVDIKNMNRPRVVTFNTGGGVVSFKARGGRVAGVVMKGGTPSTADKGSKLPGGAGGGKGRLAKAHRA